MNCGLSLTGSWSGSNAQAFSVRICPLVTPFIGNEVSIDAPPQSGSSTVEIWIPNQVAGASVISAIDSASASVDWFEASVTFTFKSSNPRGTFEGRSILVHHITPSWLPVFFQIHSLLLLFVVILHPIVADSIPLSSLASKLQTNLSPRLYSAESQ